MIFLTTNTDGWDEEGIGSICQWNLLLFCIAKDLGIQVSIPPFQNITHYDYTDYSSEQWSKSFTDFFKFPYFENFDLELNFDGTHTDLKNFVEENKDNDKKILIHVPKTFIVEHGQKNIKLFFERQYLKEIKNNLQVKKIYFSEETLNISLHIRSNNSNDVDFSDNREVFLRNIDTSKFINLIEDLKEKHTNEIVHLHVHSQGELENFYDIVSLSEEKFQIFCHLNEHPTVDIYHMSNADFLIMANSSYSWICHLLNYNPTYVRDNFWHAVYPNAIFLNSDYKIKL